MTKVCPRCKKSLDESSYNWKIKFKQLAAYCKECSREYVKDHYKRHQDYYVNKALKRRTDLKERGLQYILNYLETHHCVDCGERDILVLEFDHKDRSEKYNDISKMLHMGVQPEKLVDEISKCEVRCANCHRRKTAKENNSWKFHFLSLRP